MTTADTQALLADLSARLGPDRVIVDPAQLITYEVDGSFDRGRPDGVVFPRSVDEVVQVVRWAARHHVPLIARGSGTGLAGGAVPEHGGVVRSEEHTSELQSPSTISYAVFCLKKKFF